MQSYAARYILHEEALSNLLFTVAYTCIGLVAYIWAFASHLTSHPFASLSTRFERSFPGLPFFSSPAASAGIICNMPGIISLLCLSLLAGSSLAAPTFRQPTTSPAVTPVPIIEPGQNTSDAQSFIVYNAGAV